MYRSNLQPYSRVVHLQREEWNAYIQMSQMILCPAVRIPDGGLSFSWVGCVMRGGGGVNQSSFQKHFMMYAGKEDEREWAEQSFNSSASPFRHNHPSSDPFIHTSIQQSRVHISPRTRTRGSWVWAGHSESMNDMVKEGKKGRKKKSSLPFKPKGKAIAEGTENNKHSVM